MIWCVHAKPAWRTWREKRHGRIYPGLRSWTLVHARWLSNLTLEHPAQYLTQQVTDVVSTWSMASVIEAYQAMRGVAFLTAVTFVAGIGDRP